MKPVVREIKAGENLYDEPIYVGRIRQIVDSKVLGSLYGRLGMIKIYSTPIYVDPDSDDIGGGEYNYEDKSITLTFPLVYGRRLFQSIHSTIVHELRHALDYSLSKGKSFDNTKMNRHTVDTGEDNSEYHRDPSEINARTSEAMLTARSELIKLYKSGTEIDRNSINSAIMQAASHHDLIDVFGGESKAMQNKAFKKIYNRIFKYLERTIEYLKNKGASDER
jgi:hypothetical protein